MKVYVLTRRRIDDEEYPEGFYCPTVEKVFLTKAAGVNYLKTISVTDILSNVCPSSDGWYVDESEEMHTDFDSGIVTRSFHARTPLPEWWKNDDSEQYDDYEEDAFYEKAIITFILEEKEVEH